MQPRDRKYHYNYRKIFKRFRLCYTHSLNPSRWYICVLESICYRIYGALNRIYNRLFYQEFDKHNLLLLFDNINTTAIDFLKYY